jgi:hypothetical protein
MPLHVRQSLTVLGAALVAGALAACSGDATSPTGAIVPDSQIESDVAVVGAVVVAGDASDYGTTDGSSDYSGAAAVRMLRRSSAAAVTIMSGCVPISASYQLIFHGGTDTLDVDRMRQYFSGGVCQNAFASGSTDSVAYTGTDSLAVNDTAFVYHGTRARVFDVSGSGSPLASATTHVWNGTSAGAAAFTYTGAANIRAYTGTGVDTATNVTFAHPRAGEVYPDTGTISHWVNWTLNVTGARTETKSVTRHVVATFNGTNDIPLQVFDAETGALKLTCTLDLSVHRIVPGSCH